MPTENNCSDWNGKILHFERFCSNLGKFTLTYFGRLSSWLSFIYLQWVKFEFCAFGIVWIFKHNSKVSWPLLTKYVEVSILFDDRQDSNFFNISMYFEYRRYEAKFYENNICNVHWAKCYAPFDIVLLYSINSKADTCSHFTLPYCMGGGLVPPHTLSNLCSNLTYRHNVRLQCLLWHYENEHVFLVKI